MHTLYPTGSLSFVHRRTQTETAQFQAEHTEVESRKCYCLVYHSYSRAVFRCCRVKSPSPSTKREREQDFISFFFFYLFTSSWADPVQLEHNSNLEGRVTHSSNGHCALFLSSLTRPPAMYSFPPLSALCDFFGLAGGREPNVLLPRYPWSFAMIQGCPMRCFFF